MVGWRALQSLACMVQLGTETNITTDLEFVISAEGTPPEVAQTYFVFVGSCVNHQSAHVMCFFSNRIINIIPK